MDNNQTFEPLEHLSVGTRRQMAGRWKVNRTDRKVSDFQELCRLSYVSYTYLIPPTTYAYLFPRKQNCVPNTEFRWIIYFRRKVQDDRTNVDGNAKLCKVRSYFSQLCPLNERDNAINSGSRKRVIRVERNLYFLVRYRLPVVGYPKVYTFRNRRRGK